MGALLLGTFSQLGTVTAADSADQPSVRLLGKNTSNDLAVVLIHLDTGASATIRPVYAAPDGFQYWGDAVVYAAAGRYLKEFPAYPGMRFGVVVTAVAGAEVVIQAAYGRSHKA